MFTKEFLQKLIRLPADARLLFSTKEHFPAFSSTRSALIISRVQEIAAVLALLTLSFICVDATFMPARVWQQLAVGRVVTSLALVVLALTCSKVENIKGVYLRIFLLFAIPIGFLLNSNRVFNFTHVGTDELALINLYSYSPFVIATGIGLFPLTVVEAVLLLCAPMILAMWVWVMSFPDTLIEEFGLSMIWILVLILGVSAMSAISQLRFMLRLFSDTAYDGLTGLLSRKVGVAILDQQFNAATRQKSNFSMLFIDIDYFKKINDQFGHHVGDQVLKGVAANLKKLLRRQDIAIRWGGEEFLVILPNTDASHTISFISRLAEVGFGKCPTGTQVTASIGVAECLADNVNDWEALTSLADKRLYMAKQAGRNRYVLQEEAYPVIK